MEKEIYTPGEKVLVEAAKWLETKKQMGQALALDLLLLEMERQQDMMDGRKMEEWLL